MRRYIGIVLLAILLLSSGCGSSDEKKTSSIGKGKSVDLGESFYYASSDVKTLKVDTNVVALSASDDLIAGLVFQTDDTLRKNRKNVRAKRSSNALVDFEQKMNYLGIVSTFIPFTSKSVEFPFEHIIAEYKVSTSLSTDAFSLLNSIASDIYGIVNYPLNSTLKTKNFRLKVTVSQLASKEYIMISILPEESVNEYGFIASNIIRPTHLAKSGLTVNTVTERFTAQEGNTKADFLFVIDDSGSMNDKQRAVYQAANDFEQAIINSSITEYNIAVISTGDNIKTRDCTYIGSCALAVVNQYQTFDNVEEFKNYVVLGTNGSQTETGIYNAEQALKPDSYLSELGFPSTSSLSVIILSDEESQYYSRAYKQFNFSENIFTKNTYQVYTIIDEGAGKSIYSTEVSDYAKLSNATGGATANINNINPNTGNLDYSELMRNIVNGASGASSTYTLKNGEKENYLINIVSVKNNSKEVVHSTLDGWDYNAIKNSVAFYGKSKPEGGDKIEVTYTYTEVTEYNQTISQCSVDDLQACTTQEQCSDIRDTIWLENRCQIKTQECSVSNLAYCTTSSECSKLTGYAWDTNSNTCAIEVVIPVTVVPVEIKSQAQLTCEAESNPWIKDSSLKDGGYCQLPVIEKSSIKGTIFDPINSSVLAGVTLTLASASNNYSVKTDAKGNFSFDSIPLDNYSLIMQYNGYDTISSEVKLETLDTLFVGQIDMTPTNNSSYEYRGKLINAVDSSDVSEAILVIHEGYNSPNGKVIDTLMSDENGEFSKTLPAGYYTFVIAKNGFITRDSNVLIWNENIDTELTISPALNKGETRITLTWGKNPTDLDSYLIINDNGMQEDKIFFSNKTASDESVVLDRDDTSSYGPETITIKTLNQSKVYAYYVHRYGALVFDSKDEVKRSSAVVKVETESGTFTFNVPNLDGNTWKVFEIQAGNIVPCVDDSCMFSASDASKFN